MIVMYLLGLHTTHFGHGMNQQYCHNKRQHCIYVDNGIGVIVFESCINSFTREIILNPFKFH